MISLSSSLLVVIMPAFQFTGEARSSLRVGSDDLVRRGDALQYELDEGPCLDAVHSHLTVISQDLERENNGRAGLTLCWPISTSGP